MAQLLGSFILLFAFPSQKKWAASYWRMLLVFTSSHNVTSVTVVMDGDRYEYIHGSGEWYGWKV